MGGCRTWPWWAEVGDITDSVNEGPRNEERNEKLGSWNRRTVYRMHTLQTGNGESRLGVSKQRQAPAASAAARGVLCCGWLRGNRKDESWRRWVEDGSHLTI